MILYYGICLIIWGVILNISGLNEEQKFYSIALMVMMFILNELIKINKK